MNREEQEGIFIPAVMFEHPEFKMNSFWSSLIRNDKQPKIPLDIDGDFDLDIDLDTDMTPVFVLNKKGEIIINK